MSSKYTHIIGYLRIFEQCLDDNQEIALKFPQYGGPFPLLVTRGGGDEFILFELGTSDGNTFAVVQNYSRLK